MNTETLWEVLGLTAVVTLLVIATLFVTADRVVGSYYIGSLNSNGLVFRVMADVDWGHDLIAGEFIDPNEALNFMERANKSLILTRAEKTNSD